MPLYLASVFNWGHSLVAAFIASWVIFYGVIQGVAPKLSLLFSANDIKVPSAKEAFIWCVLLTLVTGILAFLVHIEWQLQSVIIVGLLLFGAVFAINSSLHSYLIIRYAQQDGVSLDVGFYYMANAMGRLIGTLLSGWVFQVSGIAACLWIAFGFLVLTCVITLKLPQQAS